MKWIALAVVALSLGGVVTLMGQGTSTSQKVVKRPIGGNPGQVRTAWPPKPKPGNELIMLSGGCFWGIEDWFRMQPGVVQTAVGYAGGRTQNPTYEQVCYSNTGHAESLLVEFDPKKNSYEKLLKNFWDWHDPTLIDRQGPDIGDQYRTAIWTFSETQRKLALASKQKEQKNWDKPIVTTILPAPRFWMAEEYHQQYDEKTGKKSCSPRTGLPIKG
ncbi:MsrA Peptide methionine sulfoxide reductase [Fimbriimonadaceae bacterium]|jgi:peptide-methionine (S)-S-oxide reductase